MKSAGIREFKTHLSAYLDEVESGEVVQITDRGRVVAEVRRPSADPAARRYRDLVDRGAVLPAREPNGRAWAKWRGLRLVGGTAQALLDAERGE